MGMLARWGKSFHIVHQIAMTFTLNILWFCQLYIKKAEILKNYITTLWGSM